VIDRIVAVAGLRLENAPAARSSCSSGRPPTVPPAAGPGPRGDPAL